MLKAISIRTYAAVAFLIFILWLPKDWEDQAQAWAVWARWLGVLNREILLWVFLLTLLVWLVSIDARPLVRKWLRKRPDLIIERCVHVETSPIKTDKSARVDGLYCNRAYVVVRNNRPDKRTLRRVTAKLHLFGAPRGLCSKDGWEIDLRHGEAAYFEIGRVLSDRHAGMPLMKPMEFPASVVETAQINLKVGGLTFFAAPDDQEPLNIAYPQNMPPPLHVKFWVSVTADDVEAANAGFNIDVRNLPDIDAAFVLEAPEENR
ncbi:hypothetical protein [Sphingomonas edaphi]|uniref:Uncharacterized protein n=1 Tax=Sphingomonas edaphi TaxID=2315689 RepID=A0A418PYT4_9SPHN|nr:hypothetical protein [Sphingomonas edaphi]RIX27248.1 hypothetical protein D3M59_09315 [Sphingomonas edaphi]